ncbi:sigma 54-interacting transcriptional regulator [Clostridium sp. AM58-1XD]|uniref:sigma 54-interacting transcriptional regulator n=1 Tax=Clostridium sp. AM58-1XD TaxID=2292307 RepID=UPI0015F6942D|nr:sigma 54-interacting transcriptional regulator [Clostridium sp. AM58-1XD]
MINDIIMLLPNEANTYYIKQILQQQNINIPVYESFGEEAVAFAGQQIKQGAKVIISRGSTAHLLQEIFTIPIVEIRYTFYEFSVAMKKAVKISRRIGLVGYNAAFDQPELSSFFRLEQMEVRIIKDPIQTKQVLTELKNMGIELIISGQKIGRIAKSIGLESVTIRVNTKNVLDALQDAQYLRNLETEKQKQFESISALLDSTQEGILSIDKQGMILSSNRISQEIMGVRIPHASVYDYFPRSLIKQILSGMPLYNEVVSLNRENVLFSGIATLLDDVVTGAVLTFQPASDIRRKEYELQKKARAKGHIAKNTFNHIIGKSPALMEAKAQALLFAVTESSVLIYGPTGTGKELFAQGIHNASPRKHKPFVAINCAALPESVLESELFGYVKGAFTGARPEGKIGIFEQAHTGTIFLDEISEISPAVQARLLRVIQEREITRIGDDKIIPVDVRIIASTNRNLLDEIENKSFREDLYYRLSVLNLNIPPLNSRKEDIPLLVEYFLSYFSQNSDRPQPVLAPDALLPLQNFTWPGNIRQLRNIVECAVALCQHGEITRQLMETVLKISGQMMTKSRSAPAVPSCSGTAGSFVSSAEAEFPASSSAYFSSRSSTPPTFYQSMAEAEREKTFSVLAACKGNKTMAAKELGIGYTTLWRRLKKYGMQS